MKNVQILLTDREGAIDHKTIDRLASQFTLHEIHSPARAIKRLPLLSISLVIVGSLGQSIHDGLDTVGQFRQKNSTVPIILLSQSSCEDRVIASLRAGVTDYFRVPIQYEELRECIHKNISSLAQEKIPDSSTVDRNLEQNPSEMIGESQPMQKVKDYLFKVARTDSTVLISGETGTGKELAAELIYRNSVRKNGPFIRVNSAAIPDGLVESELFGFAKGAFTGAVSSRQGLFEQAVGGTILFDEVSEMSLLAQAKILRVLENKKIMRVGGHSERPLDVRVIAATNQEPELLLSKGRFRKDLFYRLNVARIHIPPLRKRKDDIPLLIEHFLQGLNHRTNHCVQEFSPKCWAALLHYDWPGNIRELKNTLESTFITNSSPRITYGDLPKMFQTRFENTTKPEASERDRILNALFITNWNKSKAAKKLNWSRMTLYRKIDKHKIVANRPIRTWSG
jgi:DNA-binding NtrC family response regulator